MRFPFSKVYRAFPELDRFSDADCVRYLAHIQSRERSRLRRIAHRLVFVLAIVVYVACVTAVIKALLQTSPGLPVLLMIVAAICMAVGAPVLLLRDLWLQRAIARHLNRTCCPMCRYSLLGLPVADGATTCPECGKHITLADRHLTPEDLLAKTASAGSASHQEDPA